MNPFRNILTFSLWDLLAKTFYFLAFIFMARVLGVESYGVLEFAIAITTYGLLLSDGGIEVWATREIARSQDVPRLVARVIPLRLLLATAAFGLLLLLLWFLPAYPGLHVVVLLFGLTFFVQAANLKCVLMGHERLARVGRGLAVGQVVFAIGVFGLVRDSADIYWVPVVKLVGDLVMAGYFGWAFVHTYGTLRLKYTFRESREVVRPALTMGTSQGLGLLNYNFDTLMLGWLVGPLGVGIYNAAYRPVTVVLALPLTYFLGLFPALSRLHQESQAEFKEVVGRSLRLASIVAFPLGVGGVFFSEPVVMLLFGSVYAESVPVLQVLIWSAVLVILRGTYRQGLNAANLQRLDLRCAGLSAGVNVGLNVALIPTFGVMGAATATLLGDLVWFAVAGFYFHRHVAWVSLPRIWYKPAIASAVMAGALLLLTSGFWVVQAVLAGVVYFGVLLLLGETEVRTWFSIGRPRLWCSSR